MSGVRLTTTMVADQASGDVSASAGSLLDYANDGIVCCMGRLFHRSAQASTIIMRVSAHMVISCDGKS
jgi:hypothetical protein